MAKRKFKNKHLNQKKLMNSLKIFLVALSIVVVIAFGFYKKQENDAQNIERQAELAKKAEEKQKTDFIKEIAPIAIAVNRQYGIHASVTIAQAALESDFGRSGLAAKFNNLFGIKGSDPSNTKVFETKEFVNNKWITITDRFRVYSSYKESIEDHALLFVNGTSWNENQYQHVLAAKTPEEAANALEQDGYATDPDYAKKLVELIDEYNLTKYD